MSLSSRLPLVFVALLTACDAAPQPTPSPAPAAPMPASPSAARPQSVAPPARVVRLPPASIAASSQIDEPGNRRLSEDAFDGDASGGWCVPMKAVTGSPSPWVEATFGSEQRLRSVRVIAGVGERLGESGRVAPLHGRAEELEVRIDGKDGVKTIRAVVDPTGHAVLPALDVDAKAVRVSIVRGTRGKKHDDACIAEIELYGDEPSATSPAGAVPRTLPSAVAPLVKAPRPVVAGFLAELGFSETARKDVAFSMLTMASVHEMQLDDDPAPESIVELRFEQTMAAASLEREVLAVLDDTAHGSVVLGRRVVMLQRCRPPQSGSSDAGASDPVSGPLTLLSPVAAREPGARDLLLRTLSLDVCDSREGRDGAHVLTIARGMLETIARWESRFTSDSPLTPPGPTFGAWLSVANGSLSLRDGLVHAFDAPTFRFR